MSDAEVCKCKHTKMYHMFTTIKSLKDGEITPIVFCLECECSIFKKEEQN